jgi:hypothetical protein
MIPVFFAKYCFPASLAMFFNDLKKLSPMVLFTAMLSQLQPLGAGPLRRVKFHLAHSAVHLTLMRL